MLFLVLILPLAAFSSAQDQAKSDDGQGRQQLTPFNWQKPAPQADAEGQEGKPKFQRVPSLSERAAQDDDVTCEQGVLHPTGAGPGGPAAAVLGGAMGVQHCRKKSDPNTVIKRPVSNADLMSDAIKQAMSPGQVNSISGPGFRPLRKPKVPRKNKGKPAKVKKEETTAPAAPAPAPAPEKKAGQFSGETPALLR